MHVSFSVKISSFFSPNVIFLLNLRSTNDDVDVLKRELIVVQQRMYEISLEKEQEIHIQLKDNGIGMSDQKIAYYSNLQLNENNEKLLIQKDGIGLNLVAQLLLIINGKISFLRNTEG